MPRFTGAELVAESLIAGQVPYVFGIPGHGDVCLFDALVDRKERIEAVMVMHEQSAVHMADAYYRVSGQPCASFTSIGPGACNTTIGMAQAFVDSTATLLITGSTHTYMRGKSVLQELDRYQWSDFPNVMKPVSKQSWQVSRVDQVPFVMQRAFNKMLGGRPGPVHIDLPMDVQAEAIHLDRLPELTRHIALSRPRPDAVAVHRAARVLAGAQRPVVLIGGGVITAGASELVQAIAEHLGAAVMTTWMGKGAIPEDHDLYALHPGSPGSDVANTLLHEADVVLSFGCRFTDWSFSSYHKAYNMQPDCKLIQVDIDPHEIGKNYGAAVEMVADARSAAQDILAALQEALPARDWRGSAYHNHIAALRQAWYDRLALARNYTGAPTTISHALAQVRKVLPRDGIVVTGAGLVQNQTYQEFPVYGPRQHITSGGFSTMGFTVPGAIGAKLAAPEKAVVGLAGDGDFLQTMQELAVMAQRDIGAVIVVMNNCGFSSIRNLQEGRFGKERTIVTEFKRGGLDYSANLAGVAREFGIDGVRVENPAEIGPAVERAIKGGAPALVEVMVGKAGLTGAGWWDVPVPEYLPSHASWLENRRKEQL